VSAYNDIEEAREEAYRTFMGAADADSLTSSARAQIQESIEAAYEGSASWFDWGESEAGNFWALLGADTALLAVYTPTRAALLRQWLESAGVAVASSAMATEAASFQTLVLGTAEGSADTVGDIVVAAGEAGSVLTTAASSRTTWIVGGIVALAIVGFWVNSKANRALGRLG